MSILSALSGGLIGGPQRPPQPEQKHRCPTKRGFHRYPHADNPAGTKIARAAKAGTLGMNNPGGLAHAYFREKRKEDHERRQPDYMKRAA